jgi:hypothetical protein
MTHDWIPSTLGHGETMCRRCFITNREAAALGVEDKCLLTKTLRFKSGFDHRKLTWSRPDSRIVPFCSNCFRHIPDDDVPLMMWDDKGACVQFCDDCAGKCLEVVK